MRLSHSKLNCILGCPMTYFLKYKMGINLKQEKAAFAIGTAVHWGLEHETSDLSEYYAQDFKTKDNYTAEQALAEAMLYGYFKIKDKIYEEILYDPDTKSQLEIVDDPFHELTLTGDLQSFKFNEPHSFLGIIDLLFLVKDKNGNLFFIIIDYKTSSVIPTWNDYLEQIYRYIFLVKSRYPQIPVKKIGIINLRKSGTKKNSKESVETYAKRLRAEYAVNEDNMINCHMYNRSDLDDKLIEDYLRNLSRQADVAALIDLNNAYYINFGNAVSKYGKSEYYDIFYQTKGAQFLYNISDKVYDDIERKFVDVRDCVELDMKVINTINILNKYEQFKAQAIAYFAINEDIDKDEFFNFLRKAFVTDDKLLEMYWNTLLHDIDEETK